MSFGFFFSNSSSPNSSSRRFLGKAGRSLRLYQRRIVAVVLLSFLCSFFLSAVCFAQGQRQGQNGSEASDSIDSFLTGASADKNSRSRTNGTRPPEPKRSLEGLFYPEGFLTPSTPSPDPSEILQKNQARTSTNSESASSESTSEASSSAKTDSKPPRFLDPGLETTPFVRPIEPPGGEHSKKGRLLFFAISIALAALGLFWFFDYRYREQLRRDLERNARLSSPQAVSGDFADFPPGALDAPVIIPQRNPYESDGFQYGSSYNLESSSLSRPVEEDGESLEANFDFTPQGTSDESVSLEPQEDFVVSKTDE